MNKKSLVRKIGYILAIVVLLLPLYALGRPESGLISQLRSKHKMGQADLGKLDPASESMRLASLGMKGIAATVLWVRADYYKEEKYFDRFTATLNQISLLQPHFVSVWQHQAHNLGFNVSPEFEDYRQRFEWVKKGIDYLAKGIRFNERKPILQYDLGQQYFGHKMGKSDEKVQFREMYRNDVELHSYLKDQGLAGIETSARGFDQRPDSWLTGRLWLNKATELYESGATIKKVPHLLYSYAPAWRMYYAEAIESEGILDSRAGLAWKLGGEEWASFGKRTLYQAGRGRDMSLLGEVEATRIVNEKTAEFDRLTDGARERIVAEIRSGLTKEEQLLIDTPIEERKQENFEQAMEIMRRLEPTFLQISSNIPPEKQAEMVKVQRELTDAKEFLKLLTTYRNNVNYQFWENRCKLEQRDETLKARRLVYEAERLIDQAELGPALERYDEAWFYWAWIFQRYPLMMTEELGDDVFSALTRYRKIVDAEFDDSFVLSKFLEVRRLNELDGFSQQATDLMESVQRRIGELSDEPPVYDRNAKPTGEKRTDSTNKDPDVLEPKVLPKVMTEQTVPVDVPAASDSSAPIDAPGTGSDSPAVGSDKTESTSKLDDTAPALPPTLENPDFQN
jgi:hypothetical protein